MKSFFSVGLLLLMIFIAPAQSFKYDKGYIDQKSFYEVIPFEVVHEKIVVPVEINGKTYRFLVDTGAPNVISKEVYEVIKPKFLQSVVVGDANNKSGVLDLVVLEKIKLGTLEFNSTIAFVKDLKNTSVLNCFEFDGFVGSNLFKNAVVHFDWEGKKIILTDKAEKLGLQVKSQRLKLVGAQKAPYVEVTFSREKKQKASEILLIDTGMDGFYDISMRAFQLFNQAGGIFEVIQNDTGNNSIGIFGAGDKALHSKVRVHGMTFGETTFENVIAVTTNDDNSRIGLDVLKHGKLTLDFKYKKWYFEGKESVKWDKPISKLELSVLDEKLVVGFVWDEMLKNRFAFGDPVLQLNDINIEELSMCDILDIRKNQKTTHIVVKAQDGSIERINLMD